MKLKINRSLLLEEVNKANKIVDVKAINPNLLGIMIEVDNDSITFLSSNGTMNWKSKLNKNKDSQLKIDQTGKILIKGRFLIEILRKIDDEVVELAIVEKNELLIRTEKVRFNLQILDADEYPLIGFRETGIEIELQPRELRKAISQTIVSIDEFNKKIIFTGMNFQGKKDSNQLKIFTTDSFRISTKTITLQNSLKDDVEFTIATKTINEVIRLLDAVTKVKIFLFDGYITFLFDDNALFQTTLIEGKYPNVERAFPTACTTTLKINKNRLIKALNRANLTNEEGMTPIVSLEIDKDAINFSATSPEVGNYEEKLTDFEFDGEQQKISFNIKYLLEAFRTFEDENIIIRLISATKPLEVQNEKTDKTLKHLILPLSIG